MSEPQSGKSSGHRAVGGDSVDEVSVGDMSDHAREGCAERDKIELTGARPEFQAIPFHEVGAVPTSFVPPLPPVSANVHDQRETQ